MAFDLSLVGKTTERTRFAYTWRDVALYALGIGAKREELDFLYEGRGPKVIPSFAVVPKAEPMFERLRACGGNLAMLVHGGERVRLHKAFAPAGVVFTTATIRGIYDMRMFGGLLLETETRNEGGELLATTSSTLLFRGEGGFGGEPLPKEKPSIVLPKDKPADFRVEEATSPEQALLYRLSGDANPLHADPAFAKEVGFEQGPILHGLCTFGHMVRHAAKGACQGDATKLTAFEASFKKPVWPGETLVTEGYVVEPGKLALSVRVKERNEIVLANAWATYEP